VYVSPLQLSTVTHRVLAGTPSIEAGILSRHSRTSASWWAMPMIGLTVGYSLKPPHVKDVSLPSVHMHELFEHSA
jgi:hypothetical protein